LVFWFQCSRRAWDHNYGSQFTCEFQLAEEPRPGLGTRRCRFGELLDRDEWAVVSSMNASAEQKQRQYFARTSASILPPNLRAMYQEGTAQSHAPMPYRSDAWFKYHDSDDVSAAGEFVRSRLEGWIGAFLAHSGAPADGV
jgi:hypothetical protein